MTPGERARINRQHLRLVIHRAVAERIAARAPDDEATGKRHAGDKGRRSDDASTAGVTHRV